MKNFGTILLALASGASLVAAMPAPGGELRGPVVPRGQHYYALHVRKNKDNNKGNDNDNNADAGNNAGNSTLVVGAANNGTAADANDNNNNNDNNDNNDNENDNADGEDAAADAGEAADAAGNGGILDTLLGLLNGGAAGQADDAGAGADNANQDPLAILQGLLNNAA
ncbi:hypothetical protein NPX13_g3080 [Xylaria arbuscula]|uniref:Uncharacterized protein n=1 Tax=Xylaria arbuscula TaxID=114810 RepID=A0A9W8NI00_9PEZI|nr:hypothetical protein NPX13_g3080 [Xylaria arbuscula]